MRIRLLMSIGALFKAWSFIQWLIVFSSSTLLPALVKIVWFESLSLLLILLLLLFIIFVIQSHHLAFWNLSLSI